jgi:hypothetical protein
MKKIFIIAIALIGCRKIYDVPTPPAMPSIIGSFNVAPNPTSGLVTMSFLLDESSKYNLQVVDINGKSLKSLSISSSSIQQNFSSFDNGTYDLILIDITGKQYKTPLIIKK